MRVLVTGGSGHIAKAAIARLLASGWDEHCIDLATMTEMKGISYAQCNILDYPALLAQTQGCDAVVHLAALRGPSLASGPTLFEINVTGTYNVFEAAAESGIKRVVQASSINALGAYFSTGDMHLQYLPVDEQHPSYTTDSYSFSKQLIEEIGLYYWRREGISSTALRFPGVYRREAVTSDLFHERMTCAHKVLDAIMNLPPHERTARIAEVKAQVLAFRLKRPFEQPVNKPPIEKPTSADNDLFQLYMTNRYDLWSLIDEHDAAQAVEKSLSADYVGSHPLFITGSTNMLGYSTQALIQLFYPEVTRFTAALRDRDSLVSIEKARQLIGYEPEFNIPTSIV